MKELMNIIENIEKKHPNHIIIDEDKLKELNEHEDNQVFIETVQEYCNQVYDAVGFNDELLELQVYINKLRNKYDVTDPREITHWDNGKGFVQ